MERCHARKSKIHSKYFHIRSWKFNVQIVFTSLLVIRMFGCSIVLELRLSAA
jgi:hypothetical protein